MTLAGKKIIVTGALGGIGGSVCARLTRAGAHVVGIDISRMDPTVEALTNGAEFSQNFRHVDVSDREAVERFFEADIELLRDLFAVVHTVGVAGPRGNVDELDLSLLPSLFSTNVFSMFYVCALAVPIMKKAGRGRIIAIGSVAGRFGYRGRSAYSATKWSLEGVVKSLAVELGPCGIAVNTVAPGPVAGAPIAAAIARLQAEFGISDVEAKLRLTSQSSMGSLVEPDHVAEAVHYLLSPAGEFITGQSIAVDGGVTHLN